MPRPELAELAWTWLAAMVPLSPLLAFFSLGTVMFLHRAPSERWVVRQVMGALWLSWSCAVATVFHWLSRPEAVRVIRLCPWFSSGESSFDVTLQVDPLSATMWLLTSLLTLLIGRFSVSYLHREPGFARFFLLLSMFSSGMLLLVGGGSLDMLFVGWEWVGLASALLIGFFHERSAPLNAGLRAFGTYRVCDVGLLAGLVLLHHLTGTTEWSGTFSPRRSALPATALGLCLLLAAMGKSAQVPLGGWLPRAMEGPTPSSALFYGALSVHAGLFLLLRSEPLLEQAPVAKGVLVVVGLLTAIHATVVWRVQTDVKNALAHGVQTQVGLMFMEVGLGLYTLALVHLVAHACLRCLQLLRAPSALRDVQARRAALQDTRAPSIVTAHRLLPTRFYRLALERFAIDVLLERWLVKPVLRLGHWLDGAERRWVDALDSGVPRPAVAPAPRPAESAPSNPTTGAA
ncbi:proton-conducting transporter transmembrane domain-containing protein [Myxococcus qinghaiensis]|uniref:proton-conducting transporter transmembrane domain-containing protein n=1 Tax=Myxococcus qinghaiensis TaxID=2906758 RepID=UPI0020A6E3D2|nr:proton-conducting transporter membrane subunit [Myxococcus qinghaiensis]MCP3168845.1 proton-conducting membrane transporter [Myxococcus qinghaiensis]